MKNFSHPITKSLILIGLFISFNVFGQASTKGGALRDKNLTLIFEDDKNLFYLMNNTLKPFQDSGLAFSFDIQRDYKVEDKEHPEDVGLKEHFLVMCNKQSISTPSVIHLRGDGMLGKLDPPDFSKGMYTPDTGTYQRKVLDYVCTSQLGERYKSGSMAPLPQQSPSAAPVKPNSPPSVATSSLPATSVAPIQTDIGKLIVVYQPDADAYYPAFSKRSGEQGTVVVRLIIDQTGTVEDVALLQSSTFPRLDRAAADIGKRYRFKPFLINGSPVKISTNLMIKFNLKDGGGSGNSLPTAQQKKTALETKAASEGKLLISDGDGSVSIPLALADLRTQSCRSTSTLVGKAKVTNETVKEDSKEKQKFYLNKPEKLVSGIRNVKLEGNTLLINMPSKGLYQQYEAPASLTIQKTNYEGNPVTTTLVTLFSLGTNLLTDGKKKAQDFAGCTDEYVLKKEMDLTQKSSLGNSQWLNTGLSETIVIEGFDKPYSIEIARDAYDPAYDEVKVDLSPMVASSKITGIARLNVACKTCEAGSAEDQKEFYVYATSAQTTLDMRQARQVESDKQKALNSKEEKLKSEKAKLDQELKDIERLKKEKELQEKKKAIEQELVNIDRAKPPIQKTVSPSIDDSAKKITQPTKISEPEKVVNTPKTSESGKLILIFQPDVETFYPALSKRLEEQGQVVIKLTINEKGEVDDVLLVSSSSFPRLDRAAVEMGKQYKFKPYLVNGVPAKLETQYAINFNLKNKK